MKELFRKIKINYLTDTAISLIVGIVLLAMPGVTMALLCKVIGILLVVAGGALVISFFVNKSPAPVASVMLLVGLLVLVLGLWIFGNPSFFISLIPVIAGIVILLNGIINLSSALSLARYKYDKWWIALIFAGITILLALYLILNPMSAAATAVRIIGIVLIYDSISNLWIASRVHKFVKNVEQEAEAIDTDGEEL